MEEKRWSVMDTLRRVHKGSAEGERIAKELGVEWSDKEAMGPLVIPDRQPTTRWKGNISQQERIKRRVKRHGK